MPNKANILGVIVTYTLTGNDQIKAININVFLRFKDEMIAKQAGRHSMKKVFNTGATSVVFE